MFRTIVILWKTLSTNRNKEITIISKIFHTPPSSATITLMIAIGPFVSEKMHGDEMVIDVEVMWFSSIFSSSLDVTRTFGVISGCSGAVNHNVLCIIQNYESIEK